MSTSIEWTKGNRTATGEAMNGETWNPTTGCTEKSEGCVNCYAAKMAWRLMHMHGRSVAADYAGTVKKLPNGKIVWTGQVNLLPQRLLLPAGNKQPTTYFPGSMSDLFHDSIPFDYLDKVFAIMMLSPQHIFQVLTKRTDRMYEYIKSRLEFEQIAKAAKEIMLTHPELFFVTETLTGQARKEMGPSVLTSQLLPELKEIGWYWDDADTDDEGERMPAELIYEGGFPARHIWLGTSIENQKCATDRHQALYELHRMGWITWISNEPVKSFIDWENPYYGFVNWIVTGGESGHAATPMHPAWAMATRDFCKKNNIPFFFKQWGEWFPFLQWSKADEDNLPQETEKVKRINKAGGSGFHGEDVWYVVKRGKNRSGRLLDGREHNEMAKTT